MTVQIAFTDLFDSEASKAGIRRGHVRDAIQNNDQQQHFRVAGLTLVFFKAFVQLPSGNEHYLLIQCYKGDDQLRVDVALKMYPNIVSDPDLSPLQMLEAFLKRFGCDVTVGTVTSKLIFKQEIPVSSPKGNQLVSVANSPDQCLMQSYIRVDQRNGKPIAQCALVYAVDTGTYIDWLNSS